MKYCYMLDFGMFVDILLDTLEFWHKEHCMIHFIRFILQDHGLAAASWGSVFLSVCSSLVTFVMYVTPHLQIQKIPKGTRRKLCLSELPIA